MFALERLVTYYPKKEYWAELIAGVQRKPGFSDRFSLDIYRLMLATGGMRTANDYMEMAQLALQAGFAAEGKAAIEKGFAAGVLGTGAEADRQKRLRDLAVQEGRRGARRGAGAGGRGPRGEGRHGAGQRRLQPGPRRARRPRASR